MEPAVIFGGFLKPGQSMIDADYTKATAIIITFIVNNHHNKTKLIPALEWEER